MVCSKLDKLFFRIQILGLSLFGVEIKPISLSSDRAQLIAASSSSEIGLLVNNVSEFFLGLKESFDENHSYNLIEASKTVMEGYMTPYEKGQCKIEQLRQMVVDALQVKFKRISSNAKIPVRAKEGDAGYDLFSCQTMFIDPMDRVLVPIGIALEIPEGYYGRIAPRSGLAVKSGIDVLAGVVDSGYRDEIKVVLINLNMPKTPTAMSNVFGNKDRFLVKQGERIAQLIIEKCHKVDFIEQGSLSDSERNEGGFGSSGK